MNVIGMSCSFIIGLVVGVCIMGIIVITSEEGK